MAPVVLPFTGSPAGTTDAGSLLPPRAVARRLGISTETLDHRWKLSDHRDGLPAPRRVGRALRWSPAALQRWIDQALSIVDEPDWPAIAAERAERLLAEVECTGPLLWPLSL